MRSSSLPANDTESAAAIVHLRVLLVEDSSVICGLIAEMINGVPGVTVIESVESESDAIEAIRCLNVDVVVLDLQLRKGTGFGVLRAVAGLTQKPAIVVLTNFAIKTYRDTALAMGARDFLDKSRDYDRLPSILTEIASARAP
jgi:DNA-binding NarL/FixJ family response regulator